MKMFQTCLFVALGCTLLDWTEAGVVSTARPLRTERDLKRDLFETYDKLVRPVIDPHAAVEVEVSLSPTQLYEVDEKHQNIVLESYFLMKWKDDYLKWEPSEYNDIKVLRVASTEVWKPDLALYTASSVEHLFPASNTQVLLYPDGSVLWVPMQTFSSRCPVTRMKEKLRCNIKVGSWTFSAKELNPQLKDEGLDLSNFQDINPDWKLVDFQANRVSTFYPCCPGEDYPNVNFNLTLKARSLKDEWTLGY